MSPAQLRGPRVAGLTRTTPFQSLHGGKAIDKRVQPAKEAPPKPFRDHDVFVTAPPMSDSSSDDNDGSLSDVDEPSPPKKRKFEQAVSVPTTTTASEKKLPEQQENGRRNSSSSEGELFPDYMKSDQGKRKIVRTYGSSQPKNIHEGSTGVVKQKKEEKKKEIEPIKATTKAKPFETPGPHFRAPLHFKDIDALNNKSESSAASKFVVPQVLEKQKPATSNSSFKPPAALTSPKAGSGQGSSFKIPAGQKTRKKNPTKVQRSSRTKDPAKGFKPPGQFQDLKDALTDEDNLSNGLSMPIDDDLLSTTSSLSSVPPILSSPSESDHPSGSSNTSLFFSASQPTSTSPMPSQETTCPLCKSPVSPDLLSDFRSRLCNPTVKRLSIQQQSAFHQLHLTSQASEDWKQRNYPEIDWSSLSSRLEKYQPHLVGVLEATIPSFFRHRLKSSLETNRKNGKRGPTSVLGELARGEDGAEDVGYYGGKGARVIADWVILRFSKVLRKVQAEKTEVGKEIIASGGVAAYVQKVCIPEIADRLIVEDLEKGKEMREGVRERIKSEERRVREEVGELVRAGDKFMTEELDKDGLEMAELDRVKEREDTERDEDEEEEENKDLKELARWIAVESAQVGRLLCEEEDDEVLVQSEEGENGEGR